MKRSLIPLVFLGAHLGHVGVERLVLHQQPHQVAELVALLRPVLSPLGAPLHLRDHEGHHRVVGVGHLRYVDFKLQEYL